MVKHNAISTYQALIGHIQWVSMGYPVGMQGVSNGLG